MFDPYYVTTPIYYVNSKPHLGHAYTTVAADVIQRFNKMLGINTFFTTGTDEHGDKIARAANQQNKTPREFTNEMSSTFKRLWTELNISNDRFIRTTTQQHISVVKTILQRIYNSGDVYFNKYKGLYCFDCERFYNEREIKDKKCPDHDTKLKKLEESNYFFRMGSYQEWLIDHIKKNPDFIRPKRYKNEILSFLQEPLEDLCISRPKSRITWGIELPFDNNYVTYVWFDALLNYLSALGYPDKKEYTTYWPNTQHLIAKDILKPHGIYWPIMLKAASIPIYKHLNVHGYWKTDHKKMSKSIGNTVNPVELKNKYGVDQFRFFLMRDMVFGLDSTFSEKNLITRINSDLANDLGNLFSRVISMSHKFTGGKIPSIDTSIGKKSDQEIEQYARETIVKFREAMSTLKFHKALSAVWRFIAKMNKYIDVTSPWELAKNKKKQASYLNTVIYNLLEGLRIISALIYPVMPKTAEKMQLHLGCESGSYLLKFNQLEKWNLLKPGTNLAKKVSIFPRIEIKKEKDKVHNIEHVHSKVLPTKPTIDIRIFDKIDLRVATIIDAQKVPKSKKLIKIRVNVGSEDKIIVSGISNRYKPEDIVGLKVLIIANLEPIKIMGISSEGILLAAKNENGMASLPIINDKLVKAGTIVN